MDKNKKYLLGIYEKAMPESFSLKEKLLCAKNNNYDWLELSIDATDKKINRIYWTKEERFNLLKDINEVGLPIKTINASALTKYALGSNDKITEEKGLEIITKTIELASDIGVRFIQIPGYDVYYEKSDEATNQRYIKNIKMVVDYASKHGVTLGFETMENEYMNTVSKASAMVKKINSPYLQIYPDLGNTTNACELYKQDISKDFINGKGHILGVHLKETKTGIFREVPFGQGHTRFDEGIKVSKELGIKLFLAEFWCLDNPKWQEEVKFANQFLREKLDSSFYYGQE